MNERWGQGQGIHKNSKSVNVAGGSKKGASKGHGNGEDATPTLT